MKNAQRNARKKVLVLGGAGFIGKYAVMALTELGIEVVIGSRRSEAMDPKLPGGVRACPRVQVRLENLCQAQRWDDLLHNVSAVINCVGILRQRVGENYHDIHNRAPAALAQACKDRGVRFVHVSALGLNRDVKSRFLLSKRHGENAIQKAGGDWHIVRPSLVDGAQGFGAWWVRKVANWPVQFLPRNARGQLAAIDGRDLGEALARIALHPRSCPEAERIYEFGGNDINPMSRHLLAMRTKAGKPLQLWIPVFIARLCSHLCDLLHLTPYSFGHYELLKSDNVPAPNRLTEVLGRAPRTVGRPVSAGRPRLEEWERVYR